MNNISYIALGSNLNDPIQQVSSAIREIGDLANVSLTAQSSLYKTSPVGPIQQDDFINAVVTLETTLTASDLFSLLCQIEQKHARIRNERWGPRTLDCDMLLFNDTSIQTPQLTLPHPRMMERLFVLIPLHEIAAELILPNGKLLAQQISELQSKLSDKYRLTRLAEEYS